MWKNKQPSGQIISYTHTQNTQTHAHKKHSHTQKHTRTNSFTKKQNMKIVNNAKIHAFKDINPLRSKAIIKNLHTFYFK